MATAVQAAPALAADEDLAQYVDPFIGTDESNATSAPSGGKMGNAFPGATAPFGRVQWSPDNNELDGASYKYTSPVGVGPIDGFSVTHTSGAGCMSLRDLATYATVGAGQAASKLSFLHSDEAASPGYYKVKLSNQVVVELTATQRTGFGKFTFPSTQYANIVVDAKKRSSSRWVSVDAANRKISGWVESGYFCGRDHSYRLYFTIVYDRPFTVTSNDDGKVMITFDARTNLVVQSKVGTSLVSEANAAANLTSENNGWDFSAVQAGTRAAWNARLNSVKISGASPDQREIFYTALYQSMLHPNVATDSNGQYRGLDGAVHTATGYTQYVNFSGWDVYRSQVQLLAMIAPTVASDWARSLLSHAAQCGGAMPKWTLYNSESSVMIGTPAIPAIASIAAFGANGFDTQEALDRMVYAADTANATCKKANVAEGLAGYCRGATRRPTTPSSTSAATGRRPTRRSTPSPTSPWPSFAKDQRGDTATYDKYLARSKNWRNVFDPASKFIQPRRSDGTFTSSSNLTGMVEGNSAQYTWMVPHDINTVVDFIGGPATAVSRLDSLFTKLNSGTQEPYFYIGNEPSFTTPWAYLWAGARGAPRTWWNASAPRASPPPPAATPATSTSGRRPRGTSWPPSACTPPSPAPTCSPSTGRRSRARRWRWRTARRSPSTLPGSPRPIATCRACRSTARRRPRRGPVQLAQGRRHPDVHDGRLAQHLGVRGGRRPPAVRPDAPQGGGRPRAERPRDVRQSDVRCR
jgi:predicted alpha-1,2-mannosidase